jgi:hypothetical protein
MENVAPFKLAAPAETPNKVASPTTSDGNSQNKKGPMKYQQFIQNEKY